MQKIIAPSIRTAKRREQSRSAAKCRRLTETEVYSDLARVLPNVDQQTIYQSDRIGLLRLASTVCRTRNLMTRLFPAKWEKSQIEEDDVYFDEINVAQCLDGFVMIVNKAGQLLYASAGISSSIGFTQIDLAGKYLRDYVHNEDWQMVCHHLRVGAEAPVARGQNKASNSKLYFRMKTAMTPRGGRARKLTMAVYQPLQAHTMDPGEKIGQPPFESRSIAADDEIQILYCIPFALSPLQKNFSTTTSTAGVACTRHEVDMKFRFCSDKLAAALQHGNGKKLVGQSFYDLIHPEDLSRVAGEFREMYKNGHIVTSYYRLSTYYGGQVWTMTEAALLVQNIRGVTQKSIICNHHVLGNSEFMSCDADLAKSSIIPHRDTVITLGKKSPPSSIAQQQESPKESLARSPIASTSAPTPDLFNNNVHLDPSNDYLRTLVGLTERRTELYPYLMEKYGLLPVGGISAQSLDFNSILMAAMGATFPPTAQSAKIFSAAKQYPFSSVSMLGFDNPALVSSIANAPPDLTHVFLNSHTASLASGAIPWTPSYPSPFQLYAGAAHGALTSTLKPADSPKGDEIGRRHRLDAKTIESFEVAIIKNELAGLPKNESPKLNDVVERRNAIDSKTIESFEVAMIKNDLAVSD